MPAGITHHTPAAGGTTTIPKESYNEDHDHTLFPAEISNFTSQTDVALSDVATSNTIALSGETDLTWPITVRGDGTPTLQINSAGDWLTHAVAIDGDTVRVRLTASASPLTARTATLYIPGDTATFTATTADVFTVPTLATLALGLDSDDTTTVTTSGTDVTQWTDKSSNAYVIEAIGTNADYTASGINSLHSVHLSSTDSYLRTTTNFAYTGNITNTVFIVYNKTSSTQGCTFGWGSSGSTAGAFGLYDDGSYSGIEYAGATSYQIGTLSTGAKLVCVRKDAGAVNTTTGVWLNGTATSSGTPSSSTPNIAAGRFHIGQWSDYGSNRLTGYVGEIIVYATALTTLQRQKVEGYLAHKWGLAGSLPADHPYKTTPP